MHSRYDFFLAANLFASPLMAMIRGMCPQENPLKIFDSAIRRATVSSLLGKKNKGWAHRGYIQRICWMHPRTGRPGAEKGLDEQSHFANSAVPKRRRRSAFIHISRFIPSREMKCVQNTR
jgi:hypothetical protein